MSVVEPSKSEAPEIDDGLYEVVCLGVDEKVIEDNQFGNNEKFAIHLRLVDVFDPDGKEIDLDPLVNRKWSEKATLYQYAKAFGCATDLQSPFDTDRFKGKRAQALIETDFEKSAWPKVTSIVPLPAKKGGAKSAPSAAQEVRQPPEGAAVDADTVSDWFKARLGEGFQRKAIIDLCAEMFENRVPGELNAEELKGLTDQLNEST